MKEDDNKCNQNDADLVDSMARMLLKTQNDFNFGELSVAALDMSYLSVFTDQFSLPTAYLPVISWVSSLYSF
jgi:hypothetical protein